MIVFKTSQFPTFSETFIVHSIVAAIQSGYDVKILVKSKNSIKNSSQPELIRKYNLMDKVISIKSIPSTNFRKVRNLVWDCIKNPLLIFVLLKFSVIKRKMSYNFFYLIKEYYKVFRAEVFHVHYCEEFTPLNKLKFYGLINAKIIVSFHGYDVDLLSKNQKEFIPILNKYVFKFIANSNYTKGNLINLGLDINKIERIYNGIDVSKVSFKGRKIDINNIRIISVGRLVEIKGHFYALKSVLSLVRLGYKIKYTIIGDGKELNNLQKFIKLYNLENSVEILGSKTQFQIFEHFESNDLFLFPSTRDSTGRVESFGIASIEAQLFGLPVIAFDTGGVSETLINGKTGFLVIDKNVEKLADKIIQLIIDPEYYSMVSKAAHNYVKSNFNYLTNFRHTENLYKF
ncbi:glycosyltransferase [Algoriphagus formosus]|uniref:glycosyltransferase n=1 Tax=Algoriphagus formosus TaxID=2007308 RepID=UPI000C2934F8|nr:glycosyltransferase [Algoriphagus formosus]